MVKQSPAKIIRALMIVTGKGNTMFSDKTTFGRSIKVWGVNRKWYEEAQNILMQHGYKSRIVVTSGANSFYNSKGQTRIWVYN